MGPRRHSILLALLFATLLLSSYTWAQTATGDIVGRITDAQGAVIVNAKVTAAETATGRIRTTTTNAEGNYELPLLPPGNYEVSAEAPNMAKVVAKVELLLGAHLNVKIALQPAAAKEVVNVTGEAPAIEVTNSELKANIDPRQMTEMPLNGRTFASLAILAPEVRPAASFDATKNRIGTLSIGGSTGRNFNLTVDGGDNKDNIVGGFLQNYTTEGIQEFVVDTHKFGADTGKSGGGVLTIATKGGTNELHAGAFFFLRNRLLDGNDFFNAHPNESPTCPPCYVGPGNDKAKFDKQNYGGSIGGPIKKNKLFFFTAVEHTKEATSITQNPTALQSLADFVALREIAPPMRYPELQNLPIDLSSSLPNMFHDTQFQARMDWNANNDNQFFFRYAQQNNHIANDSLYGWEDVSHGAKTVNDLYSFMGTWSRTLGPTKLNQFMFQYSDFNNGVFPNPTGLNVTEICFNSGACIGENENVPQTTIQKKFHFRDDFTWQLNKHSLKIGAQNIYTSSVGGTIAYDVTPWVTMYCSAADILANALGPIDPTRCNGATSLDSPGTVKNVGLAGGDPSYLEQGINQLSYYFQDDWKVTPRLTLNLGVRNDIDFGLVPTDQQRNNRAIKILTAMGMNPGIPSTDTNNWAPRLGFAWDVTGKGSWVVRGGYGWFFDQVFVNTLLQSIPQGNANVFGVLYQTSNYSRTAIGVSDALDAARNAVGMWPITQLTEYPYGFRGRFLSPDFQTPYTQQFTIGTQMEIAKNMTLSVDYVHSLGLHEFAQKDINPATDGSSASRILFPIMDPIYGCKQSDGSIVVPVSGTCSGSHRMNRVSEMTSDSRSRYDSLTFNLKRRFANHFTFGASYVLSRAVTYGGQASDWGNQPQGIFPGLTGWETQLHGIIGPQNFGYASGDERHRVVLNGIVELKGGFVVSAIAQFSSGRPYTMYSDDDNNGDGVYNDVYSNIITGDPVFDPGWAGDARYSNRMDNQVRGDPYYQTDLRVQKNFKFGERVKMSIIADMFNLFNRTNFGDNFQNYADSFGTWQVDVPTTTYDCPSGPPCTFPTAKQLPRVPYGLFGQVGGPTSAGTIGIPFQAQLGIRLSF